MIEYLQTQNYSHNIDWLHDVFPVVAVFQPANSANIICDWVKKGKYKGNHKLTTNFYGVSIWHFFFTCGPSMGNTLRCSGLHASIAWKLGSTIGTPQVSNAGNPGGIVGLTVSRCGNHIGFSLKWKLRGNYWCHIS